ncbi:MAG: FtsB family cell division protein [Nocardioides sp.]
MTGRMAVLLLVLAVLTVSYASSMRAYLHQRSHIAEVKQKIAEREAALTALEREKRRWQDPVYVRIQARKRLGYVVPGETGVQVIDIDGSPLGGEAKLRDPDGIDDLEPTAWWETAWASVELAGNPPEPADKPSGPIEAPADEIGPGDGSADEGVDDR